MGNHPANRGKVMLVAWVDAPLRDHTREAARLAGVDFSTFVSDAIQEHGARLSVSRAIRKAKAHGEDWSDP